MLCIIGIYTSIQLFRDYDVGINKKKKIQYVRKYFTNSVYFT